MKIILDGDEILQAIADYCFAEKIVKSGSLLDVYIIRSHESSHKDNLYAEVIIGEGKEDETR